jgi:hypothetical protein
MPSMATLGATAMTAFATRILETKEGIRTMAPKAGRPFVRRFRDCLAGFRPVCFRSESVNRNAAELAICFIGL